MAKLAFVTGANGFLGLNLVQELLEQGWQVRALHRSASDIRELQALPVERAVGDVTDLASLRTAMPEEVDAVFHVAGNTSLWNDARREQLRTNVKGTRNMVRVALEKKARRFVHTSSIVAYGLHGGVITEETPTRGTSAAITYVRSKALAEREVRRGLAQGLPGVIVNPANMIGPHDRYNWARLFRLMRGRRIPGIPPGGGSFCHARMAARAHVAAAERGRSGANYLLGGADISYVALVQEVAQLVGTPVQMRTLSPGVLGVYARVEELLATVFRREPDITRDAVRLMSCNLYCSSRRAVQELGYEVRPIRAMLEDCHRWMVASGELA